MLTDVSPLSVQELTSTNIRVFPNPAKEIVHVTIDEKLFNSNYSIINHLGQQLIVGNTMSASNFDIPVDQLSSGHYFLIIGTKSIPLIIE